MVCKISPENTIQGTRDEAGETVVAEVTDFDTALNLTGCGRFSWSALLACAGAFFAAGVQNALPAYSLPASACELRLSTYRVGLVNVAFMCGGVASAFIWGIVADVFGLKRTLILTLLLDSALTLAQSAVKEFEYLMVARALNGFLIGGPSTLVMTYLSDLVGEKRRQMFLNITGLSFMLAWLILPAAGWLIIPYKSHHATWLSLDSWRLYVAACSAPGFAAGLWMMLLPESPRLLLDTGRGDTALDILARMFSSNTGKPAGNFPVKKLIPDTTDVSKADGKDTKHNRTPLLDVFRQLRCLVSRKYAVKSSLISFIFFANMAAGFGLTMWIPELLVRMKRNTEMASGKQCDIAATTRISDNNTIMEVSKERILENLENLTSTSHTHYQFDAERELNESIETNEIMGHMKRCKDNLDAEVYVSGLIVGLCCVLGNAACSVVCALGARGVRRAGEACALACAGACVGVLCCVCACVGGSSGSVAAVATLNAASLNGNILLIRLLLYALPPRLSALGVCWGAWWGRAGGVASNLAIGVLLDVSCAAPFIAVAVLLALSAVGIMMVKDAGSDVDDPSLPKTQHLTDKEPALTIFITTHM